MQTTLAKRIISAYFAAILCAATIVLLPHVLGMISHTRNFAILDYIISLPLAILLVGLPYALLLSPLFILAAHRYSVRHPAYYIISSAIAGYIIDFLSNGPTDRFQIWVVAAGAASGFVFWLIAGRHVGRM